MSIRSKTALTALVVGELLWRQNLERDHALELLVLGPVDDTHPAFADAVEARRRGQRSWKGPASPGTRSRAAYPRVKAPSALVPTWAPARAELNTTDRLSGDDRFVYSLAEPPPNEPDINLCATMKVRP